MDAKDLRAEAALTERSNDGGVKFAVQYDTSKSHDAGAGAFKGETPSTRPCAVIGPDRVVPPAREGLKKTPAEPWLAPDSVYRRLPDYPYKMSDHKDPARNISPRQTFQENMQRIIMPPGYNATKLHEDPQFASKNNKMNVPIEVKYCDVPYNSNHQVSIDQKQIRSTDHSASTVNPLLVRGVPPGWPAGSVHVRPLRTYGAPEVLQYPDYTNCAGPRPVLTRAHEEQLYPDAFYHESNIRFKPYPNIKERYPQSRYEYLGNYPNPYHPPNPYAHKYELPKTMPPHPYPGYPQVPKYSERINEPLMDGYQRAFSQQNNYCVPIRNPVIHSPYRHVPGNSMQTKLHPYPLDPQHKPVPNKLPYDPKMYLDYDTRTKPLPMTDNYYLNELPRSYQSKNSIVPNYASATMQGVNANPYYIKDNMPLKNYDYGRYKNIDPSMINHSLTKLPPQFSPSTLAISPADSNASNETALTHATQEDCGYVSQSSVTSVRSMDSLNRMPIDPYGRYDYRYGPIIRASPSTKPDLSSNQGSQSKKDIRQFISSWSEGDEESAENSAKRESIKTISDEKYSFSKQYEGVTSQEQLYVLGLVNVPSEELSKYEHIQKVSKLPENIKGYNSLELLNQFEEAIESSKIATVKPPTPRAIQIPLKSMAPKHDPIPRALSPLDVEAKISQSVIHKDVGCNFEIKPCSPKMLNVEVPTHMQTLINEREIKKVTNPHIKSPVILQSVDENIDNTLINKAIKCPVANTASSCKMVNSQHLTNSSPIDHLKTNYSLQDLESNSGVCLASLPRLDTDIELNFPEVNQQFINANKSDSVITTSFPKDLPTLDIERPGNSSTDYDINYQFSPKMEAESDFSRLSKYRKLKRSIPGETDMTLAKVQASRVDSVIIKNPDNTRKLDDNADNTVTGENVKNDFQEFAMNLVAENKNSKAGHQDISPHDKILETSLSCAVSGSYSEMNMISPNSLATNASDNLINKQFDVNEESNHSNSVQAESEDLRKHIKDPSNRYLQKGALDIPMNLSPQAKYALVEIDEETRNGTEDKPLLGENDQDVQNQKCTTVDKTDFPSINSDVEKINNLSDCQSIHTGGEVVTKPSIYRNDSSTIISNGSDDVYIDNSSDSPSDNHSFDINTKKEKEGSTYNEDAEMSKEDKSADSLDKEDGVFYDKYKKISNENTGASSNRVNRTALKKDMHDVYDTTSKKHRKKHDSESRLKRKKKKAERALRKKRLTSFADELIIRNEEQHSPTLPTFDKENSVIQSAHPQILLDKGTVENNVTENVNDSITDSSGNRTNLCNFDTMATPTTFLQTDYTEKYANNDICENILPNDSDRIKNDMSLLDKGTVENNVTEKVNDSITDSSGNRTNLCNFDTMATPTTFLQTDYTEKYANNDICENILPNDSDRIKNDMSLLDKGTVENNVTEKVNDSITDSSGNRTNLCNFDTMATPTTFLQTDYTEKYANNDICENILPTDSDRIKNDMSLVSLPPWPVKNCIEISSESMMNRPGFPIDIDSSIQRHKEHSNFALQLEQRASEDSGLVLPSITADNDSAERMMINDQINRNEGFSTQMDSEEKVSEASALLYENEDGDRSENAIIDKNTHDVEVHSDEQEKRNEEMEESLSNLTTLDEKKEVNTTCIPDPDEELKEQSNMKINSNFVNNDSHNSFQVNEMNCEEKKEPDDCEIRSLKDEDNHNDFHISFQINEMNCEETKERDDCETRSLKDEDNHDDFQICGDDPCMVCSKREIRKVKNKPTVPKKLGEYRTFVKKELFSSRFQNLIYNPSSLGKRRLTNNHLSMEESWSEKPEVSASGVDDTNFFSDNSNDKQIVDFDFSNPIQSIYEAASPEDCSKENIEEAALPEECNKQNVDEAALPEECINENIDEAASPEECHKHNVDKAASPEQCNKENVDEAPSPEECNKENANEAASSEECNNENIDAAALPEKPLLKEGVNENVFKATCLETINNESGLENMNNEKKNIPEEENDKLNPLCSEPHIENDVSLITTTTHSLTKSVINIGINSSNENMIEECDQYLEHDGENESELKFTNNAESDTYGTKIIVIDENTSLLHEEQCDDNSKIGTPQMNSYELDKKIQSFVQSISDRPRFSLKRSLSDSALNAYDDEADECSEKTGFALAKKRKKVSDISKIEESHLLSIIQSSRRNSISTLSNENFSFCILIDDHCIVAQENYEQGSFMQLENDVQNQSLKDNVVENEKMVSPIYDSEDQNENTSDTHITNYDEDKTWVDDVGCEETIETEDIAENIVVGDTASPKERELSDYESDEEDLDIINDEEVDHTSKVKHIYGHNMCTNDAQLVDALYRTPQMDVNKKLMDRESQITDKGSKCYDRDSLEMLLAEPVDNIPGASSKLLRVKTNCTNLSAARGPSTDTTNIENKDSTCVHISSPSIGALNNLAQSNEHLETSIASDNCDKPQKDTIHSYESSLDDVLSYIHKGDSSHASSCSPEVSSTTSEDKNSSILLKISNFKGSRISEVKNVSLDKQQENERSCSLTAREYLKLNCSDDIPLKRPLLTKAAQKYIPPLRETIPDLRVKLTLPQQSLLKLQKNKVAKDEPKFNNHIAYSSNNNIKLKREIPKKVKPKFEDVLKNIDEAQFQMHKEKTKKSKKYIPKVVIKKSENGSHYASTSGKETFNPDLTGRRWQPWVFIEKNKFIDNMAKRNKTRAVFSHRRKSFILADTFCKYKSVTTAKFVISQPKLTDYPTGNLKYTIKLKHR